MDCWGSSGCWRHRFWYHKVISTSKKNSEVRRNERYKLLRENIFERLANLRLQNIDYDGQPKDAFKLHFNYDNAEIKRSNYYEEAEMHLSIDLPDYLNGLAKLERNVGEYNADVDRFIDHRIPELVTNYLHDNLSELAISNHRTETEPMNSISLPRLLSWLNDYWLRGREFDVHYADGNFNYKWTNIATIPNELEARLREMTTELQNHFEIKSQTEVLQKRSKELIERAEGLCIEMRNTIIFPIERKSYKTTCKECP